MKIKHLLVLSFLFSSQVCAETGSILQDWFWGPSLKMNQINGKSVVFGGLRGGWIMNHSYGVGAGMYFSLNKFDAFDEVSTRDKSHNISFVYGGFEAEYIGKWKKRIHYTIHSLIGFGSLSYGYTDYDYRYRGDDFPYDSFKSVGGFSNGNTEDDDTGASDGLFVIEPSLNIEVNITKKLRFNTGVSYRAVAGVKLNGFDNSDLSGFGASIVFKSGQYK